MFENSPVNTQTGQPALDHIRLALNLGSMPSPPTRDRSCTAIVS